MKIALAVLVLLIIGGWLYQSRSSLSPAVPGSSSPSPAASVTAEEQKWQATQATSSGTDTASLEKDINGTVIQEEDFSDLK